MPPTANVKAERYSPLGRTLGEKNVNFNVVGDRTYIVVENPGGGGNTTNLSVRTSELKMAFIILFDNEEET